MRTARSSVAERLAAAGCLAAREEAALLAAAAGGDAGRLEALVERRTAGEPLAWLVGWTTFCGHRVSIEPGVYVPRPHTELLARRARSLLPAGGTAVDLCTGSGAVAVVLEAGTPPPKVVATDVDPVAVACARTNGVDARLGDLDDPLPRSLLGTVDVLTAVVPYVPADALPFLPRDVLAFESRRALDGGAGGLRLLSEVVARGARWLRPGGWLLLELGGGQAEPVEARMRDEGYVDVEVLTDEDGDDRAIAARRDEFRLYPTSNRQDRFTQEAPP